MLNNPVKPQAHKIIDILKQTDAEWTFRVENELPIRHGQFMQLSLPKIGEAPISISGFGDGYADFTIRKVGKVTDELFNLKKGSNIFIRGCYGNGWPTEQLKGKNVVIIAGGTGVSDVYKRQPKACWKASFSVTRKAPLPVQSAGAAWDSLSRRMRALSFWMRCV